MNTELAIFISSVFWGFVIGTLIGYGFSDSPKIIVSVRPKKAPPPDVFRKP
tara:strand:+ start:267 stop:419 length:153 start_codon:yes stop_codon:yes gene_type:complete